MFPAGPHKGGPRKRLVGSGSSGGGEKQICEVRYGVPRLFSFALPRGTKGRRSRRLLPPLRRLLVAIRELDEPWLVERAAEYRHAGGERVIARVAHRHRDRRHASRRRKHLTVVSSRSVEVADQSRNV